MKMIRTIEDTCINPAPDFENFRKVLLSQKDFSNIPFYELYANGSIMGKILGRKYENITDLVEFYYRTGYDYVPVGINNQIKRGNLADTSQGYPVTDIDSYAKYQWPKSEDISFGELEEAAKKLPQGMKIVGQMSGIFENVEGILGYENMCIMLMEDRPLVQEIFAHIGEIFTYIYSFMAKHESVGALVISDDMGFKSQTLISPDDIRELVLPWHRKFAEIAHAGNKPCILHSCGQLSEIMDDIIDYVKIDAKHSYEDVIMPVTEAKKKYGKRISILGGFDLDRLSRSSCEEVRDHAFKLLRECGSDGGYALGSGNSIADYVPVENYLTMLDEGWKFRENNKREEQ
jgi:uroporphyrinogen decarboxylase